MQRVRVQAKLMTILLAFVAAYPVAAQSESSDHESKPVAATPGDVSQSVADVDPESSEDAIDNTPLFVVSICSEQMVNELLDSSSVTPEEQDAVWAAFREYQAVAEQCTRDGNAALHEAGLADRSEVRDAAIYRDEAGKRMFRPPDDPIWDRWRELEMNLNNCVVPHRRRHDAALRSFLDRVNVVYQQGDIFFPQPRVFLLRRLSGKRPERHHDYAMENVELDELVRQSLESGVLAEVSGALRRSRIGTQSVDDFVYELRLILHTYNEGFVQELSLRVMPPVQLVTMDLPGLVPSAMSPDVIEAMSRSGKRWRARFDANSSILQQLLELVRSAAGEEAAKQFEHEYNLALCPAIFKLRWPHTMTDWIRSRPTANEDLLSAAERLEQEFATRYDALQEAALRAGVKACSKLGTTVVSFGDDIEAHAQFDEALLDMQMEGRRAIQQLHAVLPQELQTELHALMSAGGPSMAGPYRFSKYFTEQQGRALRNWPGFGATPASGDMQ